MHRELWWPLVKKGYTLHITVLLQWFLHMCTDVRISKIKHIKKIYERGKNETWLIKTFVLFCRLITDCIKVFTAANQTCIVSVTCLLSTAGPVQQRVCFLLLYWPSTSPAAAPQADCRILFRGRDLACCDALLMRTTVWNELRVVNNFISYPV